MRKFLSLFALMLLCSIGASAADVLVASTNETSPEHVYTMRSRNEANYYLSDGLHAKTDNKGRFAFFAAGGTGNYYVYSVGDGQWLSYSDASNGDSRITLSDSKTSYFKIEYVTSTGNADGDKTGYTLQAYSGGSLVSEYMNFYKGHTFADFHYQTTGTVGFWQDGKSDGGSVWVLEEYSLTWKKPQFGGVVWTWNTATNKFDAAGQTSTATPGRLNGMGAVVVFDGVGTVTASSSGNTSDRGGVRVLGNGDNVTTDLKTWAGSIEVEKFAIANVDYGHLKSMEPASSATVWVDGELNFGNKTACTIDDGEAANSVHRWFIGENGVIKSKFTSVTKGTRSWSMQVVVADEPEQAGLKRVQKTISKKVMTWGADISSHISSITVWYKDAEGNYNELPQSAVTYDATGITITYEGYANEFEYISLKNKQHSFYIGYRTSDNKIEGKTEKDETTTWKVVATDDGKYMLKNGDFYMGAVPTAHDQENSLTTSEADAEKFIIEKSGDHYTLQLSNDDTGCSSHHNYLHGVNWTAYPGRGIIYTTVRWTADSDASKWTIETEESPVSDADVAALQTEIDGLITNHMIGEVGYPTWYCQEVQTLMGGYCTNFEGGIHGGMVTIENYNDALEALNAFYSATDVVMPEDGKAYTISNVTPNGSKRMLYYRNDGNAFNNYLRASDNNTNPGYEHTFYCRKVGENKFVFVNEMGIYVEFQRALEHAAGETYRSNYNDFTFAKMVNDENPRAAFGAFSIYGTLENIGEGYLTARSGSFNAPSATLLFNDDDAGSTAFVLTEVENPNKVKVSCPNPEGESLLDGKYVGTFSANYNVELRNGLKAYTAALSEDKQTVVFTLLGEDGTIVPKHTGVLVYSENAEASITKDAIPAIATVEVNDNIFLATNGGSRTINVGDLVLGNGSKGVGFYLINPDKRTVGRNKAYIPGSAAASVARYMFDFENDGTLTEIEAIEVAPAAGNVYDLQGRRVQNAQKGLYIVNGKKVVR